MESSGNDGADLLLEIAASHSRWRILAFGLDDALVEAFLGEYGFMLLEQKSPEDLEKMYFTDNYGVLLGKINATQSIALGEKL